MRARHFVFPRMKSRRAFTLVEIMVVVVIIGLLAAIALPGFARVRRRAQASRYANDFKQFAAAFQRYNLEHGGWPPAQSSPGAPTVEMTGYLPASWSDASPMGGGYTWSGDTGRIRLTGSEATDEVMQLVDAALDDGDLTTGDFNRMSGAGNYHLQLR